MGSLLSTPYKFAHYTCFMKRHIHLKFQLSSNINHINFGLCVFLFSSWVTLHIKSKWRGLCWYMENHYEISWVFDDVNKYICLQ